MSKRLTTYEYKERAIQVHGDKYDYSNVNYINTKSKVCIICAEHGEFWQQASSHLSGRGCPLCQNNKPYDIITWTKKARSVHGDRYDYSQVVYIKASKKVCIICPEHGEFYQESNSHMKGHGCPICRNEDISIRRSLNTDMFISKAINVHGDRYDYSKVDYINCSYPVEIYCRRCNKIYKQRPGNHLFGQGCPHCNESHGNKAIQRWLQKNNINYTQEHKFDDCRNINPLPFDFYLPKLNMCIEYDGKQHFKPIEFFGGKEGFNKCKKHDSIKNQYCIDNNIKLMRIRYDESVSDKLMNIIKH